jgi:hypothetical protein
MYEPARTYNNENRYRVTYFFLTNNIYIKRFLATVNVPEFEFTIRNILPLPLITCFYNYFTACVCVYL